MQNITAAIATLTGKIVYPDGIGPGQPSYIPIVVSLGDNCCEEHAKNNIKWLIEKGIEADNEYKKKFPFRELSEIVWD